MGAYTPNAQVWYPDTSDTAKINTLMATMASSIEDGLEPRLAHQEIAVGLKASLAAAAFNIPAGSPATVVPYAVSASRGDFNNGFTFSAGTATVQTAGMYFVSASVGPQGDTSTTDKGVKIQVEKNGVFIAGNETKGAVNWVGSAVSCVLNCVPGDTIRAKAGIVNSASSFPNSVETTHISIALVQATPL